MVLHLTAEPGSEGGGGEPGTDDPLTEICTWHPNKEEDTVQDMIIAAPTLFPGDFKEAQEEETAMAASLPAAEVSAARQEGLSGTPSEVLRVWEGQKQQLVLAWSESVSGQRFTACCSSS